MYALLTVARLGDGLSLEEVARRDWPVNRDAILGVDGGALLTDQDRAFLRGLRARALTAVVLCIDR